MMRRRSAPVVNPSLAKLLANEPNPVEALAADQASAKGLWAIGVAQADFLKHGRVVRLSCGHFTSTKATSKAQCPRCGEMIRAGYDHDAFHQAGRSCPEGKRAAAHLSEDQTSDAPARSSRNDNRAPQKP